jgi:long-chain fatty acid transport protein
MTTFHRVTRALLASAVLAAPAALHAQAFGLNEIGSCAVARGFANTAAPCKDASTIFWNPAAATSLPGWNVTGGLAAIAIKGTFTQDTSFRKWDADVPTAYVPHLFVNYHRPTSKAAFGIGVYVPYGLTSQWTDDFPGRFSAKKASLQTIYVQPNFAWQLNDDWSIGGGPVFGHSTVELIQGVDLAGQLANATTSFTQLGIATGTEFARVRLKGSATGFGAQLGVAGRLNPNWNVGVRFMAPIDFKYDDADATFTQVPTGLTVGGSLTPPFSAGVQVDQLVAAQFASGGALTAQKVKTKITHPAQIQAGASYSGYRNWLLEADYAWVGWKRFDYLEVNFQGTAPDRTLLETYNNSSALRFGAEYTTAKDGWKLRGGLAAVASAAPAETVTPLLPEQDRTYFTFGAGIPFWGRYALDASYARIYTSGSRGRISERTTVLNNTATAAQLNTGVYDLSANVFSFTLKASF